VTLEEMLPHLRRGGYSCARTQSEIRIDLALSCAGSQQTWTRAT
jgi:hypothetical protein